MHTILEGVTPCSGSLCSCVGDIKLAQVRILASRVQELAVEHDALAIIAGDFNSTPSSAIYSFCAQGELGLPATDRRTMSGQVEDGGSGRLPVIPGHGYLDSHIIFPLDSWQYMCTYTISTSITLKCCGHSTARVMLSLLKRHPGIMFTPVSKLQCGLG